MIVNDVSVVGMIIPGYVCNVVSMFVTHTLVVVDDDSLAGTSGNCFASYDACFDDTEGAKVSCNISAGVKGLERCMFGSIRVRCTEMLDISRR